MTSTLRRLSSAAVVMALAGVTLFAQQTPVPQTTPRPSPSVTPPRTPEPRYEQPGQTQPAQTREQLRKELQLRVDERAQSDGRFEWHRPVFRFGQAYELKADDTVHDISGVFSEFKIDGHVTGDLVSVMGDVTLGEKAAIDGSLVVVGGNVHVTRGAKVDHDFVVVGGVLDAPADFAPGGEHVLIGTPGISNALRAIVPWVTRGLLWGRVIVPDLGWIWGIVGIALLIGVLLTLMFNRPIAACADTAAKRPLSAFLMGLLVLMLMPIFLTILAASVIGIVVVPFAIAAFIVAGIMGRVAVARALGRLVFRESDPDNRADGLRSLVIGSAVLIIIYMVPVLGLLTWMFVGSFALGSATMTAFGAWRKERPAPPPKPVVPPPHDERGSSDHSPGPLDPRYPGVEAPGLRADAPGLGAQFHAEPAPPIDIPPAAPAAAAGAAAVLSAGDLTLFPRATFLDRLAAVALDFVLVGIAAAFFGFDHRFNGPGPFFMLLFLYHLAFWGWKGTTLGGIICSLRIVRSSRGPLRFVDAVVRSLSAIFSVVALGIGYFWMISDAERQTWHDKIAGTFVVKLPRELVLE